jgi:Tfp pilus assembly protein PilV
MKTRKYQNGSVILEVLVAAVIFAVALLALVTFQTNLLTERGVLSQESIALSLAQDRMQSFRNYTVLTATTGFFAYTGITNGSSTSTNSGTTYTLTWTVTDATDTPTRKTVNIVTTWTDAASASHSVSINSVIASIDPRATGQVSQNLP